MASGVAIEKEKKIIASTPVCTDEWKGSCSNKVFALNR
jgi:hypothetical protein